MNKKIKILFIGEIISSHAQSWIQLLKDQNDYEVLVLDIGADWTREKFDFPVIRYMSKFRWFKLTRHSPFRSFKFLYYYKSIKLCNRFNPDIVHTLGLFPASIHYLDTQFEFKKTAKWFVQVRGGPDLEMNRHDETLVPRIKEVFQKCDKLIADNQPNYNYAQGLGILPNKLAFKKSIPGTGGIDLAAFAGTPLPSKKEPILLWPKAYNCIQSDGFVVIEGIKRALQRMPEKIHIVATATTPEIKYWLRQMLPDSLCTLDIYDRIPREELLAFYKRAKVLLAPSLSDGIPNTLYEAMASHAVPIVSPLATLTDQFKANENVLYANNLDPEEISQAIVVAFTDSQLTDQMAKTNYDLVAQIADQNSIRKMVLSLYSEIVKLSLK